MSEPPLSYNQDHDDSSDRSGGLGPNGTVNHSAASEYPNVTGPNGTVNHIDTSAHSVSKPGGLGSYALDGGIAEGCELVGGRYIVKSIKYGGMGVVYQCLDTLSKALVALKTVQTTGKMSDLKIRLMQRNYKLVHGLLHDHIVRVNSLERDDVWGQWFMVMDWVDGDDLESRLTHTQGNCLPADETIRLLRQVADALDYAHKQSVVHRDVKCANIMVKANGDVQLIDFGIAGRAPKLRDVQEEATETQNSTGGKPAWTTTTSNSFAGTRGYQSPEQWKGEKATPASDQYSLAVTAYRCLAGHLPFWNGNEGLLMEMVQHEEVPNVGTLPPAANAVLAKGLSKQPGDRYPDCTAFIDALAVSLNINTSQEKIDLSDFYFFVGTVEKYRKEIEQSEWDRGQTFGHHLDAFYAALVAASEARGDRNYEAAYYCLKQAETEWKWLEFKRPLREQATARLAIVQQAREKAEKQEAERYAKVVYQEALQMQEEADAHFEMGEFREAMNGSYVAEGTFGEAEKSAHENHIHWLERSVSELINQKKFDDCEEPIHELSLLDEKKAADLALSVKNSKGDCIVEMERQIETAIKERRFSDANEICQHLAPVAMENSERWKASIQQAKEVRVNELQRLSTDYIAQNRFDEAIRFVQELISLDPSKAAEWETRVQALKSTYATQLEKDIDDLITRCQFKEAEEVVGRLAMVSEPMARAFEGKLESAKSARVVELAKSIADDSSKRHFSNALAGIDELSALDMQKADSMKNVVDEALNKFTLEIDHLLEDAILTYRFDDAEDMVRQLELLDTEKAGRWREAVAISKNARIDELKREIRESLLKKSYHEAKASALKLRPLNEEAADECEQMIQASQNEEIGRLKQGMYAALSQNGFDEAAKAAQALSELLDNKEEAEKLAAYVASAKDKEIENLEQAISTAIGQKQFDEAVQAIQRLRSLDAQKADEAEKSVEAAKIKEIDRLGQGVLEAIGKKLFKKADDLLAELAKLNAAIADELKGNVAIEKENYSRDLEHDIGEAILGKQLKEAIKAIHELELIDRQRADVWWRNFKSSVADSVQELETSIDNAVKNERFGEADDLVQQLEEINQDTGNKWKKIVDTTRNKRFQEIEKKTWDAMGRKAFDEAFTAIQPLSSLSPDKFNEWKTVVSNAKDKCIGQLKDEISEAVEKGHIKQAEDVVRKLYAVDADEALICAGNVALAKDECIKRLELAVQEAIRGKHYNEASSALVELEALAPLIAGQLTKDVENDRNEYIAQLKQSIDNCINNKQFEQAGNAILELKRLEAAEVGELEGVLYSARERHEREMAERRMKAIRRIIDVSSVIIIVLFLALGAICSWRSWRRFQALKNVSGIYVELVSKRPGLSDWNDLEEKISRMEMMVDSRTLDSSSLTLHGIMEEISRHQDYNKKMAILERRIADIYPDDLREEWEGKVDALKVSEDAGKKVDALSERFDKLLDRRDDSMLSAIAEFGGMLNMVSATLGNLAHANHEMSLKSFNDFTGKARYILFWYDEKNETAMPSSRVDQAWMAVWDDGKTYSEKSSEADCRRDAMAKASELRAKMEAGDQWETCFRQLWGVQYVWSKKGLDAARHELDDLDKKAVGFGRFEKDFRKAFAEVKDMVFKKEAERIEVDVRRKKAEAMKLLTDIGDRSVTPEERKRFEECDVKLPEDKDLEKYLESCLSDIAWLRGLCDALKRIDEAVEQHRALTEEAKEFERRLDNLGTAEIERRLEALKEKCGKMSDGLKDVEIDVFSKQRSELSSRFDECYQNIRKAVVIRLQNILAGDIESLTVMLKQMEDHSRAMLAKDYPWNGDDAVTNEKNWYRQKQEDAKALMVAMGDDLFEGEDSLRLQMQEAKALFEKIDGMADEVGRLLLPSLADIRRGMSACGILEGRLKALQQEMGEMEKDISADALGKLLDNVAVMRQAKEDAEQLIKNNVITGSKFLPAVVVLNFETMRTEINDRLATLGRGIDEMNAMGAWAKSLMDGVEKVGKQVSTYEKQVNDLSDAREGDESEFARTYQDIQKTYNDVMAAKPSSGNAQSLVGKRQMKQIDEDMARAADAQVKCREVFKQMKAFDQGMSELEAKLKILDGRVDGSNASENSSTDEETMVDEYIKLKQKVNDLEAFSEKQKERKEGLLKKGDEIDAKMQRKLREAFTRYEQAFKGGVEAWSAMLSQLNGMKRVSAEQLIKCRDDILGAYGKLQTIPIKENDVLATKEKSKKDLDESVTKKYREGMTFAVYDDLSVLCNGIEKKGGIGVLSQAAREKLKTLADVFRNAQKLDDRQWEDMISTCMRQMKELRTGEGLSETLLVQPDDSKTAYLKELRKSFMENRIDFEAWYDFLNSAMTEKNGNGEYYGKLSKDLSLWEKVVEAKDGQSAAMKEMDAKNISGKLENTNMRLAKCFDEKKVVDGTEGMDNELNGIKRELEEMLATVEKGKDETDQLNRQMTGGERSHEKRLRGELQKAADGWEAKDKALHEYRESLKGLYAYLEFLPIGIEMDKKMNELVEKFNIVANGGKIPLDKLDEAYQAFGKLCKNAKKIKNLSPDLLAELEKSQKEIEEDYNNVKDRLLDEDD